MQRPILIAGPTASGKSDLAMAIAERTDGLIVNADSMQVYAELAVLTARPSPADTGRLPHRLYGHMPARDAYSVARWLDDIRVVLDEAARLGKRPIVVGGTGLYFKALTEGLAPVPAIAEAVRAKWRTRALGDGAASLHAELAARDPVMASRLARQDTQRIVRALEVVDATGRSLADWQAEATDPILPPDRAVKIVVERPRAELVTRADKRFGQMIDRGAIEEVRALLALGLAPELPAMRALGVRPIAELLGGRLDRQGAIDAGQRETRAYIKRQLTWLKRNMITWKRFYAHQSFDFSSIFDLNID